MRRPSFYGWIVLGAGAVCYGFGISPAYYGWGTFAPAIAGDLSLDRGDVGGVFGLFNVLHQCVGLLVGIAVARLGLRPVMAAGSVVTALGMLYLAGRSPFSTATSGSRCSPGSASGARPWSRARRWPRTVPAAAGAGDRVTLTAGAVVGAAVPPAAVAIGDWREAWRAGAVVAAALAGWRSSSYGTPRSRWGRSATARPRSDFPRMPCRSPRTRASGARRRPSGRRSSRCCSGAASRTR